MKISGAHVVVVVALAVIGLLVYGGAKMSGKTNDSPSSEEEFLQEIREIAPTASSTEEGLVPPLAKADEVPKIEIEPSGDVDLGTIPNDSNTTMQVKVHNRGKAPLKILKITTSCGCTKATMEEKDKTIAPGEFSYLAITADPSRITAGFESRKSVTLNTNDPAAPTLKFDVVARVNPEYALEPAQVAFGAVEKGTVHEQTLVLRQLGEESIAIKNITSQARNESLEVTHELRPKEQWQNAEKPEYNINVRLADHVPLGPYSGRFMIMTTCKRRAQLPVTVTATVTSWYSIEPARMLILRQAPGKEDDGRCTATISGDRPFEITDLAPTLKGMTAEVKPGEKENSKVIEIRMAEDAKPLGKIEYLDFAIKSGDQVMKEMIEVRVIPAARPGDKSMRPNFNPSRALPARPETPKEPAAPEAPAPAASEAPAPAAPEAPAPAAPVAPAPPAAD